MNPITSAVLTAIFPVLAGCGLAPMTGPAMGSADSDDLWQATVEAQTVQLGACIDPSLSVDPAFVSAGLDELAEALRATATAPAVQTEGGSAPVPGLHVVVRQVSASSYGSTSDELLDVEVPPVPGLVEPPDPSDFEHYADRSQTWEVAQQEVADAAERAEVIRAALLDELARLPLNGDGSEIGGCVTALRDSFPAGLDLAVVVLSDLDQAGEPQFTGSYVDVSVLFVLDCHAADLCDSRREAWSTVLDDLGAHHVAFTTLGRVAGEITAITKGVRQ